MLASALALVAGAAVASASLYITSPVAGTTCEGGKVCLIAWTNDDTTTPANLTTYGTMTVGLYTGEVDAQTEALAFGTVNPANVSSLNVTIPATAGPDGDFYFIRFQQSSGTLQSFSAKFTLTDMTGELTSAASAQLVSSSSTSASASASSTGVVSSAAVADTVANATSAVSSATSAAASASSSSKNSTSDATENMRYSAGAVAFAGLAALLL